MNLHSNLSPLCRGKTVAEATKDILQVQLPRLKERMSAGTLRVDNIDVFCEQGVFDLSSTHSILQAGKDMGLNINFHGDELHPMNSAQVLFRLHTWRQTTPHYAEKPICLLFLH